MAKPNIEDLNREFRGGGSSFVSHPILKLGNGKKEDKNFGNFLIQTRELDDEGKMKSTVNDTKKKTMDLILLKRRYYYSWFSDNKLAMATSEFDDWQDVIYLLECGKTVVKQGNWARDIKPYLLENYPKTTKHGKGHMLTFQNVLYVGDKEGNVYKIYLKKTSIIGPDADYKEAPQKDSLEGWLNSFKDVPLKYVVELSSSEFDTERGVYNRFAFKTKEAVKDLDPILEMRGALDEQLWNYEKSRFNAEAEKSNGVSQEDLGEVFVDDLPK